MIHIITDSTCDLSPARRAELGVESLPLTVHFGEEVYRDGIDISNAQFYDRLRQAQELPHTAQVNPAEFEALFRPYVEQGDDIIGLFLSEKLSGTRQSAAIAAEIVGDERIYLPETGTVTFGLGLLVEMAVRCRDQGLTAQEIVRKLEGLIPRLRFYAVFDTLKYLKMGGRISPATAMVGGVLGITPIISIRDGVLEAAGKSRGYKGAFQWMEKKLQAEPADLSLPAAFGHTDAPQLMADCEAFFRPQLPGVDFVECEIGCVIGTHAGPGAGGLAYFVQE